MGNPSDTPAITDSGVTEGLSPEEGSAHGAGLVLIYGTELGKRYPLHGEVSIGRDETNGVVVDLPGISRHHARICRQGESWLVADLDSTNGTYINGTEIGREEQLASGDLIKLGSAIFKFIAGNDIEAQFYEEIYRLTILDGLTRLHNKRYLHEFLDREIARSRRHHRPLSLAILDIDHFKQLNDTYGHVAGDYVLEGMSRLIQQYVRREQLLARFGGEEFALVLPETDLEQARSACEKMRRLVEQASFEFDGDELRTSVSIGVATLEGRVSPEQLLKAADDELLRAKRCGRNRVIATGDP
jgi:diguanylate cyclase (GGDEF)-like protein